jgi:hypothetical protein
MIKLDWVKTAERGPTAADADSDGKVVAAIDAVAVVREWSVVVYAPKIYPQWARMPEIAPPKVERKLAPGWRELRADSWEGRKDVWLLNPRTGEAPFAPRVLAGEVTGGAYTHWQPLVPPRVYEDEK